MLGWWIKISTLSPEEMDSALNDKTATLAHWEVGVSGIGWLKTLVQQGKAQQLKKDGYPSRWQAQAGVILPLLNDLPLLQKGKLYAEENSSSLILGMEKYEENMRPVRWFNEIRQYPDRIAACNSEQMLTIDAWDLS